MKGGVYIYGLPPVFYSTVRMKQVCNVKEYNLPSESEVRNELLAWKLNSVQAMIAAARVFNLIDRKPRIDSAAGSGLRLNQVGETKEQPDIRLSIEIKSQDWPEALDRFCPRIRTMVKQGSNDICVAGFPVIGWLRRSR